MYIKCSTRGRHLLASQRSQRIPKHWVSKPLATPSLPPPTGSSPSLRSTTPGSCFAPKKVAEQELKSMLAAGIVARSDGLPWAAPCTLSRKRMAAGGQHLQCWSAAKSLTHRSSSHLPGTPKQRRYCLLHWPRQLF